MKANIHPNWKSDVEVTCNCGAKFATGSTLSEIKVDICSKCHPFYTGEMRFVDVQGRVERFQAKQKAAQSIIAAKKQKIQKKQQSPKSLREMLSTVDQPEKPAQAAAEPAKH
jgi:large subunit ribosomal protein L31